MITSSSLIMIVSSSPLNQQLTKRDGESSLMQLKEEFRSYDSLRREHDAQIVSIAMESRLRISAEQWSSLLYGDSEHKSHMQSILDRLQPADSFYLSIEDFKVLLTRNGDSLGMSRLIYDFEILAAVDSLQPSKLALCQVLQIYLKATYDILSDLNQFLTFYKSVKNSGHSLVSHKRTLITH